MAYGSPFGVGAYCRSLSSQGTFTISTNPTLANVENWLRQISSMLDGALSAEGFTIPLENETAIEMATVIVEQIVSDIAKGANSTGRFFADKALENGRSMWKTIADDLNAWVKMMAPGLQQMGAKRGDTNINSVGYKSGDTAFPIFQRDAYGNTFTNWSDK